MPTAPQKKHIFFFKTCEKIYKERKTTHKKQHLPIQENAENTTSKTKKPHIFSFICDIRKIILSSTLSF